MEHIKTFEGFVNEAAYIPDNIQTWAKKKGISRDINKIASWAEKAGKRIMGGTAIGKNYSTLILDLTYQGGEISFDVETGEITLYGETVSSPKEFQKVLATEGNL